MSNPERSLPELDRTVIDTWLARVTIDIGKPNNQLVKTLKGAMKTDYTESGLAPLVTWDVQSNTQMRLSYLRLPTMTMQAALDSFMETTGQLLQLNKVTEPTIIEAGLLSQTDMEARQIIQDHQSGHQSVGPLPWQDVTAHAVAWQPAR
jgi:hypothetical protein